MNTMKIRQTLITLTLSAAAAFTGSSARGATTAWLNATSGNWTLGSNWSSGVPGVADQADLIKTASSYSVDFSGNTTISTLNIQNATGKLTTLNILSGSSFTTGYVYQINNAAIHVMSNATFTITTYGTYPSAIINVDASGTLQWGTAAANQGLYLGTGTSTISGTLKGANSANNSFMQIQGGATLNINGGTVVSDKILLGANAGNGTINVTNNGTLTQRSDFINIGSSTGNGYGTTAMNVDTGGTVTNAGTLDIAMAPSNTSTTGTASLNIAAGSWSQTGVTTVGTARNGSLNLSGTGAFTTSNNTFVGGTSAFTGTGSATASGLLSITGGNFTAHNVSNNATVTVGNAIKGTLTLSGGNMTVDALVASQGSNSTVTFNGGTLNTKATTIATGSAFTVGNGTSAAALVLNGGTHSFANGLAISNNATLSGTGTVTGNAAVTGTGIINLTSGSISGTLGVTGGNWNGNGTVTGAVTSSNGTFTIGSGANLTANGGMNVTGGTLLAGNATSMIVGSVNYTSSSNSTFSGIFAGSGKNLTMNATGSRLTLTGNNTYTGATTVTGGTLQASAAHALGSTSGIMVNTGGTLLVSANASIGSTTTITMNGTGAALVFSSTYNGPIGALALNANSIFDLGTDPLGVQVHFSSISGLNTYTLSIYNWTGTTLWEGGTGNNTDQIYANNSLSQSELEHISFYSSLDASSFRGTGYQIMTGSFLNELGPVPEPSTWVAMVALIITGGSMAVRRAVGRQRKFCEFGTPLGRDVPIFGG